MARDPIPVVWGRRQFSGHGVVAPAAASRQDSPQSDSRARIRMKQAPRRERVRFFLSRGVLPSLRRDPALAGRPSIPSCVEAAGRDRSLTFRVQVVWRDRVRGDAG